MASQKIILIFTLIIFFNSNIIFCMKEDHYNFGKEAVPMGKDPSSYGFIQVKTEEILAGWHEKNGLKIVVPSSFENYTYGFLFLDNDHIKVSFGRTEDKIYLIHKGSESVLNIRWFIHSSWGIIENTIWGKVYRPNLQTGYDKETLKILQT